MSKLDRSFLTSHTLYTCDFADIERSQQNILRPRSVIQHNSNSFNMDNSMSNDLHSLTPPTNNECVNLTFNNMNISFQNPNCSFQNGQTQQNNCQNQNNLSFNNQHGCNQSVGQIFSFNPNHAVLLPYNENNQNI